MRPLTDDLPKPMVQLRGKAMIDHVLDRLNEANIEHAVVNIHYQGDKLEKHLRGYANPEIQISDERDQLLDTGGGVKRALHLLADEPFVLHNSDSVWIEGAHSNIQQMAQLWDEDKMDCLMLMALTVTSTGYNGLGDFFMEPDGLLRRREENEVVPYIYAGVCLVHPRLFENAPEGPFSMNLLWDQALEKGRLYGLRHEGVWMHVGTPQALAEAEQAYERTY